MVIDCHSIARDSKEILVCRAPASWRLTTAIRGAIPRSSARRSLGSLW
jgi:hypothetical protein